MHYSNPVTFEPKVCERVTAVRPAEFQSNASPDGAHTLRDLEDDAMSLKRLISAISIALGSVAAVSSAADSTAPDDRQSALTPALYIVQAESLNTADKSVVRVNAKVEQEFEIIHSVSASRQVLIQPALDL